MAVAVTATNQAAPPVGAATPGRELFLDAVRTVALVRVVVWHATGAPPVTYVVAAVPMMFFVYGSLLAKSLRRGVVPVLRDRAQRILVPLWVFALGAYATMAVAHAIDGTASTAVPWRRLPLWLFPVADPSGSTWEGGYMSAPLWYMRALLWIMLVSPLLLWLVRRTSGAIVAVSAAAVFVLDLCARGGVWQGTWAWRVGDLALYATFAMVGFVHRDGGLASMTRRRWVIVALVAGSAATLWCTTQPVPDHVVNDSHPAHLLVGTAWLGALFAARPWIERLGATCAGAAAINWVSQRTITIYLWHSTAVVVAYELLRRSGWSFPPGTWVAALLVLTAAVTSVFVLCFGWVEDSANHRVRHAWPVPRWSGTAAHVHRVASLSAVVGALVLVASANVTVLAGRRAEAAAEPASPRLRVPSRPPVAAVVVPTPGLVRRPTGSASVAAGPDVTTDDALSTARPFDAAAAASLRAIVERWRTEHASAGVVAALRRPGSFEWTDGTGSDPYTSTAVDGSTRFDIESITKTLTAALVWQQVDRGTIDLDAPLPSIAIAPGAWAQQLTARQLLTHTSGLVNYRDTPEYLTDPGSIDTPEAALAASTRQPLTFTPGTNVAYSSSNYLVLGALLEQVTGRPYDDLLRELLDGAGLTEVIHRAPEPGLPNFSTAGVMMTASEAARWGMALVVEDTPGLSASSLAGMRATSPTGGLGAGLIAYCPCRVDPGGLLEWSGYGHTGGSTEMVVFPDDRLAVALFVTDSIYEPAGRYEAVQTLVATLREAVAAIG